MIYLLVNLTVNTTVNLISKISSLPPCIFSSSSLPRPSRSTITEPPSPRARPAEERRIAASPESSDERLRRGKEKVDPQPLASAAELAVADPPEVRPRPRAGDGASLRRPEARERRGGAVASRVREEPQELCDPRVSKSRFLSVHGSLSESCLMNWGKGHFRYIIFFWLIA